MIILLNYDNNNNDNKNKDTTNIAGNNGANYNDNSNINTSTNATASKQIDRYKMFKPKSHVFLNGAEDLPSTSMDFQDRSYQHYQCFYSVQAYIDKLQLPSDYISNNSYISNLSYLVIYLHSKSLYSKVIQ